MSDTGDVPESPRVLLPGDSAHGFTPSWHFSDSAKWRRVLHNDRSDVLAIDISLNARVLNNNNNNTVGRVTSFGSRWSSHPATPTVGRCFCRELVPSAASDVWSVLLTPRSGEPRWLSVALCAGLTPFAQRYCSQHTYVQGCVWRCVCCVVCCLGRRVSVFHVASLFVPVGVCFVPADEEIRLELGCGFHEERGLGYPGEV